MQKVEYIAFFCAQKQPHTPYTHYPLHWLMRSLSFRRNSRSGSLIPGPALKAPTSRLYTRWNIIQNLSKMSNISISRCLTGSPTIHACANRGEITLLFKFSCLLNHKHLKLINEFCTSVPPLPSLSLFLKTLCTGGPIVVEEEPDDGIPKLINVNEEAPTGKQVMGVMRILSHRILFTRATSRITWWEIQNNSR